MNVMMMMNKTKRMNIFISIRKLVISAAVMLITMLSVAQSAFADDIGSSKLATGTQKLITDATNWLMILAPAVAVLCIIYFLIRKSISDEMDHKKWNTRIAVALISCIGAVLAAVIVNVLISYYK
jgi:uncharacterized membrane protein YgdD (TMEM256/DUF423 family)